MSTYDYCTIPLGEGGLRGIGESNSGHSITNIHIKLTYYNLSIQK
jgi:hypothetical protein